MSTTIRWLAFFLALLILAPAALFGGSNDDPPRPVTRRAATQPTISELAARAHYAALLRNAPAGDARAILGALSRR